MDPPHNILVYFPKNDFTEKQWAHFHNNGAERAIKRSMDKHNKLHMLIAHWETICRFLGIRYGWDVDYPVKDLILDNLRNGTLKMNYVKKMRFEHVAYCDDDLMPGDMFWAVNDGDWDHFIGRVIVMFQVKGVHSMRDRDGTLLNCYDDLGDTGEYIFLNHLFETDEYAQKTCKNNLDKYVIQLPVMHEELENFNLCPPFCVLQRLHYRHHHVTMPVEARAEVWYDAKKDWNAIKNKRGAAFQKWKNSNKFWYRAGLIAIEAEDMDDCPWCGTRYYCKTHRVYECAECIAANKTLFPVYFCVEDHNYVLFGSPQGNINKWNMNGSWKR